MIHLIADTHFDHSKLVDLGIRRVGDEYIMWESLKRVPGKAWLIHLGDVSIGNDHRNHSDLTQLCPAHHKILIRGNHDTRGLDWYLRYGWDHVCDSLVLSRYGKMILFSHRPRSLPDWVDINIHGHCHLNDDGRYNDLQHFLLAEEAINYQTITLKEVLRKMGGAQ